MIRDVNLTPERLQMHESNLKRFNIYFKPKPPKECRRSSIHMESGLQNPDRESHIYVSQKSNKISKKLQARAINEIISP